MGSKICPPTIAWSFHKRLKVTNLCSFFRKVSRALLESLTTGPQSSSLLLWDKDQTNKKTLPPLSSRYRYTAAYRSNSINSFKRREEGTKLLSATPSNQEDEECDTRIDKSLFTPPLNPPPPASQQGVRHACARNTEPKKD